MERCIKAIFYILQVEQMKQSATLIKHHLQIREILLLIS